MVETRIPSMRHMIAMASGWGGMVFLLSAGTQWFVYDELMNDPGGMRIISPVIAAIVTTVLAFRLQNRVRQQRIAQFTRLEIIAEMNHHIRNAMQVISYQTYTANAEEHGRIRDAINRIDWVLRDILPMMSKPAEQLTTRGVDTAMPDGAEIADHLRKARSRGQQR